MEGTLATLIALLTRLVTAGVILVAIVLPIHVAALHHFTGIFHSPIDRYRNLIAGVISILLVMASRMTLVLKSWVQSILELLLDLAVI